MKRYTVFYGGEDDAPLECFVCYADDKLHAIEQFEDSNPDEVITFITMEI